MNNIQTDYYFHGVEPKYQTDPHLILGLMGLLNSVSGTSKLFIANAISLSTALPMFENGQTFKILAKVVNKEMEIVCEFESSGTLSQCYRYIVFQYSTYLKTLNDSIFIDKQDAVYVDDYF
jgi:hypothetical protein